MKPSPRSQDQILKRIARINGRLQEMENTMAASCLACDDIARRMRELRQTPPKQHLPHNSRSGQQ